MHNTPTNYTNTTPIMSWCSYKIKPRIDRLKNNQAPLILQIFIAGKKVVINLQIITDPKAWDPIKQEIKGKTEPIQHANILLAEIKSTIHNIQLNYRLQNKELTIAQFKDTFLNRNSRADFLLFFHHELHERYKSGVIEHSTYKAQRNVLHRMQQFYKTLPFEDLSHATLEDIHRKLHRHFSEHDRRTGQQGNYHTVTIWGHFKVLKTYLNLAAVRGIKFQNPFTHFKVSRGSGRIIYLTQQELNTMLNAWRNQAFKGSAHYALQVFLFACYTSLRISDIKRITSADIIQNHIILRPQKTARLGKLVRIPLNNISSQLVKARQGLLFEYLAEQKINQHLKTIASILGIAKNISMHVGRHTFATEFLRRGGQIHVLQKIMGHSDIKTTMVYTHLNDQHLNEQMQLMDD